MPRRSRSSSREGPLPRLRAALLVGGASRRMGRPKQMLALAGESFSARIARAVVPVAGEVVICGDGELPGSLASAVRLLDIPGIAGPLAGLLAALRHDPGSAWLVLACDQPLVTSAALSWLASQRAAGALAILPRLSEERVEPFPGIYEPSSRDALDELARRGGSASSLQHLTRVEGVLTPRVPAELAPSFAGANRPEELESLAALAASDGSDR
jgi:molybdopterin-guanine dinucleotide biosynthesis protein A